MHGDSLFTRKRVWGGSHLGQAERGPGHACLENLQGFLCWEVSVCVARRPKLAGRVRKVLFELKTWRCIYAKILILRSYTGDP